MKAFSQNDIQTAQSFLLNRAYDKASADHQMHTQGLKVRW